MLNHQPFLDTIRERPDEEGPRLVYADWLEEQGDPRAAWLRLLMNAWHVASGLLAPPHASDDVWHWRDRLYQRDPAGRLVRVWACAAVRFQPLSHSRRLGDALRGLRSRAGLAVAELHACGLAPPAECQRVRNAAAADLRRAKKGLDPLAVLACRAVYCATFDAGDRAADDAAIAADLSGVRRAAAHRWQVALARLILDQAAPTIVTESTEQWREEKTEKIIGADKMQRRAGL